MQLFFIYFTNSLDDSDIDAKVNEFRQSMLQNFDQVKPREAKR